MNFHRLAVAPIAADTLRELGASSGWLIEDRDAIRVGLGASVLTIDLDEGSQPEAELAKFRCFGDDGPVDSAPIAIGSLPFNMSRPGKLDVSEVLVTQYHDGRTFVTTVEGSDGLIPLLDAFVPQFQEVQSPRSLQYEPTPEEYAHNIASAVEVLRQSQIEKVVLARSVKGSVSDPIEPGPLINRLRQREPSCTLYSIPIGGAQRFIGASPELLLERKGNVAACNPLAGTISLPANVPPKDYESWLLGSAKNLHEHKLLVDEIVAILRTYFERVTSDEQPSIMTLRTVAHLSSWVKASEARGVSPSAITLLRALHPTAAVCGIPREAAHELLSRLENHDRGHYAGPVGWIDSEGNGQWWVGIRGVVLDGPNFEAWAGAGIVSESDPIAEREETKDKLSSVLTSILIDRV